MGLSLHLGLSPLRCAAVAASSAVVKLLEAVVETERYFVIVVFRLRLAMFSAMLTLGPVLGGCCALLGLELRTGVVPVASLLARVLLL